MQVGRVAKAVVGLFALAALGAQDAVADNVLEVSEAVDWVSKVGVAAIGVYSIWRTPNAEPGTVSEPGA